MFLMRGMGAVANVQRFNIDVGTPPNFMLPPYQAGWTGHLASTNADRYVRVVQLHTTTDFQHKLSPVG